MFFLSIDPSIKTGDDNNTETNATRTMINFDLFFDFSRFLSGSLIPMKRSYMI
jgi:hypothetical protein